MIAHLCNGLGIACVLAASALLTTLVVDRPAAGAGSAAPLAERVATVVDARGRGVPCGPYERIVSLNPVADHLLLQTVEPMRIRAISRVTDEQHPERWRFGGVAAVGHDEGVEAVLVLEPDLVIASPFVPDALVSRLQEMDVPVFDLGEMRGLTTTRRSIDQLGALLLAQDRARSLEHALARDEAALLARGQALQRPGLYVSVYGDAFFGGTKGTSYSDVLRLAGVRDLAEEAGFEDWPRYAAEELLVLAPELIVTRRGMAAAIRSHPILAELPACGPDGRIVEIDGAYDGDAGLGVVQAASELQQALLGSDRAHGEQR
ncbi:MAG: ABC transporter substrate-binding protein [Planctomycetota bacterium]